MPWYSTLAAAPTVVVTVRFMLPPIAPTSPAVELTLRYWPCWTAVIFIDLPSEATVIVPVRTSSPRLVAAVTMMVSSPRPLLCDKVIQSSDAIALQLPGKVISTSRSADSQPKSRLRSPSSMVTPSWATVMSLYIVNPSMPMRNVALRESRELLAAACRVISVVPLLP